MSGRGGSGGGRRARVVKLTPQLIAELAELVETGAPVATCAASVGIAPRTFYNWRSAGLELLERLQAGDKLAGEDEQLLAVFAQRVCLEAFGTATLAKLRELEEADAKSWTKFAWILERSRPDQFALTGPALELRGKVEVEHEHRVGIDGEALDRFGKQIAGYAARASLSDVIDLAAQLNVAGVREQLERLGYVKVEVEEAPPALPPAPEGDVS